MTDSVRPLPVHSPEVLQVSVICLSLHWVQTIPRLKYTTLPALEELVNFLEKEQGKGAFLASNAC